MMARSSPRPSLPQGRPHGYTEFHPVSVGIGQEGATPGPAGRVALRLDPTVSHPRGLETSTRQAARAASCRNDPRWTLQPLILLWAMMTWCTAPTDAEQFLTTRTFYVRVHGPKRKRPGKHFGGFHEAVQRLPLTVWWAVAAAVRRQVFRTLADRMVVDGWIKTSKRVVKDVRLVSRTTAMVVREAEGSLLACPLLLAQGASALQAGSPRAGRDAEKCSASGVLREVRRELAACAEPLPKTSFAVGYADAVAIGGRGPAPR